MKKFFYLTAAMISLFFISEHSHAGTIIEPYAGLNLASTWKTGTDDGDLTGNTIGARLGFSQMGFMAGVDGRRGNLTIESTTDADYTFTQLGAFIGYEAPMMLRFWAEYIFSVEGVDDDNSDNKYLSGTGTLFGVGYSALPFVSINFELSNVTTTEFDNGTTKIDYDVDYTTYLLSISLPLHL